MFNLLLLLPRIIFHMFFGASLFVILTYYTKFNRRLSYLLIFLLSTAKELADFVLIRAGILTGPDAVGNLEASVRDALLVILVFLWLLIVSKLKIKSSRKKLAVYVAIFPVALLVGTAIDKFFVVRGQSFVLKHFLDVASWLLGAFLLSSFVAEALSLANEEKK